ncbi:MAG: TAXI family TRAP transporter solute-binding subunit, partial [Anaerotignaceae bacterium]
MKKLLTTLLATTMVVGSLAGCSSSSKTTTETPSTTETTTEAPAEGGGKAINLTFAAQEVGTGAYTMATALQGAMLKGLPSGSSIDLLTTSPGGVGAPILIQTEECDLIVSNAGPSLWSYEMTTDEYQFAGGTDVRALGGGMGHAMMNVMFTQSFVDKTGYTTLEEVIENKYPIRFIT